MRKQAVQRSIIFATQAASYGLRLSSSNNLANIL